MRNTILASGCMVFSLLASCNETLETQTEGSEAEPVVTGTEYRDGEYFWKPSRITMTLHDGDHLGTSGQYILLEDSLAAGEFGWGSSILDLPDTWKIADLRFEGLAIRFENEQGDSFRIQPPQLNELDFKILDGGDKPDQELESLWRKYALIEE